MKQFFVGFESTNVHLQIINKKILFIQLTYKYSNSEFTSVKGALNNWYSFEIKYRQMNKM